MNLNELLESLEQSAQIEKKASEQPTAVEPDLSAIEKKASEDLTKVAFAQGEELARQLLEKLANEIQTDNAVMQAQDDQKIVPTETGGTVEQALQGTVDEAVERGATSDDRVDEQIEEGAASPAGESIEDNMNKQAQENSSLAAFIMEKLAQEFNPQVSTPAAAVNVAGAPVPNKIQQDNAVMTAQDDAKVQGVVPGGDGTVNALFQTIVGKALASGAGSDNLAANAAPAVPGVVDAASQSGGEVGAGEEVEKAAAVSALCDAGLDFDSAVALVKQAEEELAVEAWEHEKQAAFNSLVEAGIDFDDAVALVKQAEEELFEKEAGAADLAAKAVSKLKGAGKAIAADAAKAGSRVSNLAGGLRRINTKPGQARALNAAKGLVNNRTAQVAGGALAAGGTAAALRGREKQACVEQLMAEGVDFDTAVELTKQAELEVYGK